VLESPHPCNLSNTSSVRVPTPCNLSNTSSVRVPTPCNLPAYALPPSSLERNCVDWHDDMKWSGQNWAGCGHGLSWYAWNSLAFHLGETLGSSRTCILWRPETLGSWVICILRRSEALGSSIIRILRRSEALGSSRLRILRRSEALGAVGAPETLLQVTLPSERRKLYCK